MHYIFDTQHAKEFGLPEAVFIQNMAFWIQKNKANKKNQFDGRTWTYNSVSAYSELFPFWSKNQVRRVIQSLLEKGVIVAGNYNQSGYDKTKWYAFVNENSICANRQMDVSEITNRSVENHKPIPDVTSDVTSDKNTYKPPLPPKGECVSSPAEDLSSSTLKPIAEKKDEYSEEFEMAWEQFGRTGTKSDAYRFWKKLTRAYVAEVMERMPAYVASQPDKQFRGHMSSWINPSKKKWRNEINNPQAPRAERTMAELEAMLGTGKGKEEG